MRKRLLKILGLLVLIVLLIAGGSWLWIKNGTAPMPPGPPLLFRFSKLRPLGLALTFLSRKGVVRDPTAMTFYFRLKGGPLAVHTGTYRVSAGESADELRRSLQDPLRQMIRMPETNWARRDAKILQHHDVTSAAEYMAQVYQPQRFQQDVDFPLPKTSLEGYLLPDTYDFPPLLGAVPVVVRRLDNFDKKVWHRIGPIKDLDRVVTVASLVELESGTDEDRPMIAGVIENRLKKGMPLQIDASILYGLGKWRRLYFKDYKDIKSPYNLYLHKGLPPTPICSPSLKSIEAALHPAQHAYLYYVALPNGKSLFAKTPQQHLHNIHLRLAALKLRDAARGVVPSRLSTDHNHGSGR